MFAALALAVAVLLAGAGVLVWLAAERLTERRPPDPPASPADHRLPYEEVVFAARDGTTLRGYWIPPPEPRSEAIVVLHGQRGSLDPDLKHAPALHAAGYGLLFFDFRAHGRSDGAWVSLGFHERADALGAIDWLVARGVERVGLLGFSMGAAVAIAAAPDHPAVAAVVADGAYARVQGVVGGALRERYKLGRLADALAWAIVQTAGWRVGGSLASADPLRAVGRLAPRALLLIHGARDPYVSMDDIRCLYRRAEAPKSLWVVPEAAHREADQARPREYERRIVEFFGTHLCQTL